MPGLDDVTGDFYKTFKKKNLHRLLQEVEGKRTLLNSFLMPILPDTKAIDITRK